MTKGEWLKGTCCAVVFSAVVGLPAGLKHMPLRLNMTASVPTGLYIIGQSPQTGVTYAGVCLSRSVLDLAEKAGLGVAKGECPGDRQPILKPIYTASAQSPIEFTDRGFVVGGKLLPNTAAKLLSRTGKPRDHIAFGCYREGLWAISSFNQDSFDSRYFGAVRKKQVLYYAAPFLLF